jgi:hypothetical protein
VPDPNEPECHDPGSKAVSCYGLLRADIQQILLLFVNGRRVCAVKHNLAWLTGQLAAEGKTTLLMVQNKTSWRIS